MPKLAKKCYHCSTKDPTKSRLLDINDFDEGKDICKKCSSYRKKWESKNKEKIYQRKRSLGAKLHEMLRSARKRANNKNIDFEIDYDYIKSIYPKNGKCPYFNKKFIIGKKVSCEFSPTLDRIDCNKGYVKGNVEIISMRANYIKSNATPKELDIISKRLRKILKND